MEMKKGKNVVVFESGVKGGYKCKVCRIQLCKKLDVLKKHVQLVHGVLDLQEVPTVKERCRVCSFALDPHPAKMQRHLARHVSDKMKVEQKDENQNVKKMEEAKDGEIYSTKSTASKQTQVNIDERYEKLLLEMTQLKRSYDDTIKERDKANDSIHSLHREIKRLIGEKRQKELKIEMLEKEVQEKKYVRNLDLSKVRKKEKIGEGGFGCVFKGVLDGQPIAYKEMRFHPTSITEVAVLLKIDGKNLLQATSIGCKWRPPELNHSRIVVGLELCGEDLHVLLQGKNMDNKEKIKIVEDTAAAIKQLHALNISHRDVKPPNFLKAGNSYKLADFGLASLDAMSSGTVGTPGYMAPEVIQAEQKMVKYSNKCDMWSLGATLHEVLIGEFLVRNDQNKAEALKPRGRWDLCNPDLRIYAESSKLLLVSNPIERISAEMFLDTVIKIKEIQRVK